MFGGVPFRLPWAGGVAIANVRYRGGVSISLPGSVNDNGVSSLVLTLCAVATGTSFTGVTVRNTMVGGLVCASAQFMLGAPQLSGSPRSVTVNVKLSTPLKFAVGVYVTLGGVPLRLPWAGG